MIKDTFVAFHLCVVLTHHQLINFLITQSAVQSNRNCNLFIQLF